MLWSCQYCWQWCTVPDLTNLNITDSVNGTGSVIDDDLLTDGLVIPVQFVPANNSTIPATTPGTIINIVSPEITVIPVGQGIPPSTIPLNSLTPSVFNQTPTLVEVPNIDTTGQLSTTNCL